MFHPIRLTCALIVSTLLTAVLSAQSSVWKVTKGDRSLYLAGTSHVLRSTDFPLPPEFDAAYTDASILYFETDLARLQSPEMHQVIAQQGTYIDGTTLEQILSPVAWKAVKTHCEQLGLPLANVATMKPWLFTIVITMIEMQKHQLSLEGVDLHFYKKAIADKKRTGEMETFENHIQFIVTMGSGHESEMVANSLEEIDGMPKMIGAMLAAWRAGDVAKIDETVLQDVRTKYPAIFESLIVKRNNNWLPRIEKMLESPETELVLVGVGHMAGPEGLLELLKARGCIIEQTVVKN